MKTIITILFLFCLPAFSQQSGVLVKTEAVATCEVKNPNATGEDPVYDFECKGNDGVKFKMSIPKSEYPPAWDAPEASKSFAIGRGTDGKLYAIASPKPAPPSVVVTVPANPCHQGIFRGEECTSEARRHPLDTKTRKP